MITIRPLRKDDRFEDLISLSRTFFEDYQSHHEAFFKIDRMRDEDIISHFTRMRDHEEGGVIIALDGDRMVGYITFYVKTQADFWAVKRVGDIAGLMVHPAYRHRGIGSRLVEKAQEAFKKASVKYFILFTAVNNREAIWFYESMGLVPLYTTMMGESDRLNPARS